MRGLGDQASASSAPASSFGNLVGSRACCREVRHSGDHVRCPVLQPPPRFHRHLHVRIGGGDLTGEVDGAVVDPTPTTPDGPRRFNTTAGSQVGTSSLTDTCPQPTRAAKDQLPLGEIGVAFVDVADVLLHHPATTDAAQHRAQEQATEEAAPGTEPA